MAILALAGLAVSATVLLMKSQSEKQRRRGRKKKEISESEGDTTAELADTPVKSKVRKEDSVEEIDDNDLINDMYLLGEIHPQ